MFDKLWRWLHKYGIHHWVYHDWEMSMRGMVGPHFECDICSKTSKKNVDMVVALS